MSVSRSLGGGLGLRFPVYHPESTIVRRVPALTFYKRVFLSLSPHTCTFCLMFSLDPSVVGLAPPCTCWRQDTITCMYIYNEIYTYTSSCICLHIFNLVNLYVFIYIHIYSCVYIIVRVAVELQGWVGPALLQLDIDS